MSECAIVTPACTTPGLWVERIILYRDIRSADIIREITLTRGLNIIWGVSRDTTEEIAEPGTLTGHSVGKSTLCRLIRYALGEKTFGRQAAMDGISYAFPNGAVGMTVHVGDTTWSVLRPIGVLKHSRAAVETDIEKLLGLQLEECDYASFTQALDRSYIHPLPGNITNGVEKKFIWENLLAWMSRDQEARYQHLGKWRSSRSEAKPPATKRQDALLLIRMVLGLYSAEEEVLVEKIEQWEAEMKAVQECTAKRQQENTTRLTFHYNELQYILRGDGLLQGDTESIFGVDVEVGNYLEHLRGSINRLRIRRTVITDELTNLRIERQYYTNLLEEIEAKIAITQESTEQDGREGKIRELEQLRGKCRYGNILFNDCSNFQRYVKTLSDRFDMDRVLQDRRSKLASDERQKQLHEWIAVQPEFLQNVKSLTTQIRKREQEDGELEKEIIAKTILLQRVENHAQERERLSLPPSQDDEQIQFTKQAKDFHRNIQVANNTLRSIQAGHYNTGQNLEDLFTRLIRLILSDQYTGEVVLPPKHDIDFRICETEAGLTGEAVETFAIVLADIAALLWSVAGNGYHPRFLLHDSPREADLDREIYNNFLRGMHHIAQSMGGDTAPFQYIVTTTTNPPNPLSVDGTLKLTLQAHPESALLLGQRIYSGASLLGAVEESNA